MCVFLCANPRVHEWLDLPLARAHREAIEMSVLHATASGGATSSLNRAATVGDDLRISAETLPGVMHRSAWMQLYFQQLTLQEQSPETWHNISFNAIANAWSRLLALVGLRR